MQIFRNPMIHLGGRTNNWIQYTHETIQVYYKNVKGVFNNVGQKITNGIIWSL